jgi:hypothetical protein
VIGALSIVKNNGTSSSMVSTVVGGVLIESSVRDEWECEESLEENSRSSVTGLPPASRVVLGGVAGK